MSLKLNSSGGGSVTLQEPTTASNVTLNLPAADGTVNTSGAVNEVPAGSASDPSIYPTGDTNTGIFFPAADTIAFTEGGAESARIDSSGRLLVGTTSSGGEIGRLTVKQGADDDSGGLRLIAPNSTNAWAPRVGSDSNFYFGYNGTSKVRIDNSNGAYNALSDARLKQDIVESSKGLASILSLRPVTYTLVDDATKANQIGLVAQEVVSVIPEIVGSPTSATAYYSLNYAGLTPILVKAIQELKAEVDSLRAQVEAQ
jgi:hypothetical protein